MHTPNPVLCKFLSLICLISQSGSGSEYSITIFACDGCNKSLENEHRTVCLICKSIDLCDECAIQHQLQRMKTGGHKRSHPTRRLAPGQEEEGDLEQLSSTKQQSSASAPSYSHETEQQSKRPLGILRDLQLCQQAVVEGSSRAADLLASIATSAETSSSCKQIETVATPLGGFVQTEAHAVYDRKETARCDIAAEEPCVMLDIVECPTYPRSLFQQDSHDLGKEQAYEGADSWPRTGIMPLPATLDGFEAEGEGQGRVEHLLDDFSVGDEGAMAHQPKYVGVCPLPNGQWRTKAYVGGDLKYICDADTEERAAAYHDAATQLYLNSHAGSDQIDLLDAIDDVKDAAIPAELLDKKQHEPVTGSRRPAILGIAQEVQAADCAAGSSDEDHSGTAHGTYGGSSKTRQKAGKDAHLAPEYALNFPKGHPEVERIMNSNTLASLTAKHEPKAAYDNDFDLREFEKSVLRTWVAVSAGGMDDDQAFGDVDDFNDDQDDASEQKSYREDEAEDILVGNDRHVVAARGNQGGISLDIAPRASSGALPHSSKRLPAYTGGGSVTSTSGQATTASSPSLAEKHALNQVLVIRAWSGWEQAMALAETAAADASVNIELDSLLEQAPHFSASLCHRVLSDLDLYFGSTFARAVVSEEQEQGVVVAEAVVALTACDASIELEHESLGFEDALRRTSESKRAWQEVQRRTTLEEQGFEQDEVAVMTDISVQAPHWDSCTGNGGSYEVCLSSAQMHGSSQAYEAREDSRMMTSLVFEQIAMRGQASVPHCTTRRSCAATAAEVTIPKRGEHLSRSVSFTHPIEGEFNSMDFDVIELPELHELRDQLIDFTGMQLDSEESDFLPFMEISSSADTPERHRKHEMIRSAVEHVQGVVLRRIAETDGAVKDATSSTLLAVDSWSIQNTDISRAAEHLHLHGMRQLLGLCAKACGSQLQPWQVQSIGQLTLGGTWLASAAVGPLASRVMGRFKKTTTQLSKSLGLKHQDFVDWIDGMPMDVHRSIQVSTVVRRWLSEVRRSGGLWSLSGSRKALPDPSSAFKTQQRQLRDNATAQETTSRSVDEASDLSIETVIFRIGVAAGIPKARRLRTINRLLKWAIAARSYTLAVQRLVVKVGRKGRKGTKAKVGQLHRLPGETQRAYRRRVLDSKKESSSTSSKTKEAVKARRKNVTRKKRHPVQRKKSKASKQPRGMKAAVFTTPLPISYNFGDSRQKVNDDAKFKLQNGWQRHPADVTEGWTHEDEHQDPELSDSDGDDDHRCTVCGTLEAPAHDPILSCAGCGVRSHIYCNGVGLHQPELSYDELQLNIAKPEWRECWRCDMCAFSDESAAALASTSSSSSSSSAEAIVADPRPAGPLRWAYPLFGCGPERQPPDTCRVCFQPPMGLLRKPCLNHGWVHAVCAHSCSGIRWKHRGKMQWPDADLQQIFDNTSPGWASCIGETQWSIGKVGIPPKLGDVKPQEWATGRGKCTSCRTGFGATLPCKEQYARARVVGPCSNVSHPSCALRSGLTRATWLRHGPPTLQVWRGDEVRAAEFDPTTGVVLDSASEESKTSYNALLLKGKEHGAAKCLTRDILDKCSGAEGEGDLASSSDFPELGKYSGMPEYRGSAVSHLLWRVKKCEVPEALRALWEAETGKPYSVLTEISVDDSNVEPPVLEQAVKLAIKARALCSMSGRLKIYTDVSQAESCKDMELICMDNNIKGVHVPLRDVPLEGSKTLPPQDAAIFRARTTCCSHHSRPQNVKRIWVGEGAGTLSGYAVPRWWSGLQYEQVFILGDNTLRGRKIGGRCFPKVPPGKKWSDIVTGLGLADLWRKHSVLRDKMGRDSGDAAGGGGGAEGAGETHAESQSEARSKARGSSEASLQLESSRPPLRLIEGQRSRRGPRASRKRKASALVQVAQPESRSEPVAATGGSSSSSSSSSSSVMEDATAGSLPPGVVQSTTAPPTGGEVSGPAAPSSSLDTTGEERTPVAKRRRKMASETVSGSSTTTEGASGLADTPVKTPAQPMPSPNCASSSRSTGTGSFGSEDKAIGKAEARPDSSELDPWGGLSMSDMSVRQQQRMLRAMRRHR